MNVRAYGMMIMVALVSGGVGGAISSLYLMGRPVFAQKTASPQKVAVAEEFRLVGKDGNLRAKMGVDVEGGAYLNLWGRDQKGMAVLRPQGLDMMESDRGHVRLALDIISGGSLKVWDSRGDLRCVLAILEDGSGLTLFDKDLKARVILGSMGLQDPVSGLLERLPICSLSVFDRHGKVAWSAP